MTIFQKAIIADNKKFGLFLMLNAKSYEKIICLNIAKELAHLNQMAEEHNLLAPEAEISTSVAFSNDFWQVVNPESKPSQLKTFTEMQSPVGSVKASKVDLLIHLNSNRHDLNFELARQLLDNLTMQITVVDEVHGFEYLDSRDITGFIDGTENPKGDEKADVALIGDEDNGFIGGSYVFVQKFIHNMIEWNKLANKDQEEVIGRTKGDSVQLESLAEDSHVAKTDIKVDEKSAKILRHSFPFGHASGQSGLFFISYCRELRYIEEILKSMYGSSPSSSYDKLLNFTQPGLSGYFFAPSTKLLASFT